MHRWGAAIGILVLVFASGAAAVEPGAKTATVTSPEGTVPGDGTSRDAPSDRAAGDRRSEDGHRPRKLPRRGRGGQRKHKKGKPRTGKGGAKRGAATTLAQALPPRPPSPRLEPPLPVIVDHRTALERQILAEWGWRADRDGQVRVPLADHQSWERIRLWGVEHLTAFRYTKQHHAITTVFALPSAKARPTSQSCMAEFEVQGLELLRRRHVRIAAVQTVENLWHGAPVVVHRTEGSASFFFSRYEFSAAWAAYPAYEGGCLVHATVVLWDGQPALARQVIDRWIEEGVRQIRPLTATVPYRH